MKLDRVLVRDFKRTVLVVLASAIMAFNIKSFVRAGGLLPGGFSGVSLLVIEVCQKFFGITIPYSVVNLSLNAIPVIISFRYIGKKFTIFSCVTIFVTSFLTDLIPVYPITYDVLLISIFGGMVNGTAIGMCLFANATSGGTDFIAIYLSEKYGVDAWNYVLVANAGVLLIAGAVFGWDKALYSLIFQFMSTQMLHTCNKRYKRNTMLVVTDKPKEVAEIIYQWTRHGSTLIEGTGTYNHMPRAVIYSVIASDQVKKVISKIKEVDETVFINVIKTEQLDGHFYIKPND